MPQPSDIEAGRRCEQLQKFTPCPGMPGGFNSPLHTQGNLALITPDQFIDKWKAAELKERSAAQEHFIDLCRLLGEPTPAEADPLYNERPTWLSNAHRDLDAAVAAAYGWPEDISDDDALAKLFELNQQRSRALTSVTKSAGPKRSRHPEAATPVQSTAPPQKPSEPTHAATHATK